MTPAKKMEMSTTQELPCFAPSFEVARFTDKEIQERETAIAAFDDFSHVAECKKELSSTRDDLPCID